MTQPGKLDTDHLTDLEAVDPYIGKTLAGRYRLLRKIGGGGMGAVYEAEHTLIGRRVAVKLLHAHYAGDVEVVRRFLNEARAAAMIGHPNILECDDMGRTDEGAPFLVLELLRGRDLASALRQGGPMPLGRSVRITQQVCAALHAAHERGIVHRDIKPENVFLVTSDTGADVVKVLDFGISKFGEGSSASQGTATGQMLGTPAYMAPEQISDASRVDRRTDVYAVGVLLYQMLSGRIPFQGDTLPALLIKIATEAPIPLAVHRPDLPPAVLAAVARALSKPPRDRWEGVDAFARALAPYAHLDTPAPAIEHALTLPAGSTPMAISTGAVTTAATPPRARPRALAAASAALAIAALLAYLGARGTSEADGAPVLDHVALVAPVPPIEPQVAEPDHASPPEDGSPDPAAAARRVHLTVHTAVEGATLTVRGATHALPFDDEVPAGLAPELLELEAPGRQGRRFWITLDQSVVLDVDLPRGHGTRDATRSETRSAIESAASAAASERPEREPPSVRRPIPAPIPAPIVPAPETAPSPHVPPTPAAPSGVYVGPSGDIPESI